MLQKKYFFKMILTALLVLLPVQAWAATVNKMRYSSSPTRVRIVLDTDEKVKYKDEKQGTSIVLNIDAAVAREMSEKVKDPIIRSVVLKKDGRKASKLVVTLNKEQQYKVFALQKPDRIVLDIYRILVTKNTVNQGKGLQYTFWQDDMEGLPIQMHILEMAPDSDYKLLPFSGAVDRNGRGTLLKAANALGAKAAVNASYFDTSGWIIGNLKIDGEWLGMEDKARSAFVIAGGKPQILKDLAYDGNVMLPSLGVKLPVKGINRERIAEDVVVYTHYFGPSTRTNNFGCEVRIKDGKVAEISKVGNMRLDKKSVVVSAHGANAKILEQLRIGDRASVQQSLGNAVADQAELVLGAGPLLVEAGKRNVRSGSEQIAGDIAYGRAPRTAIGVKKDGTVVLLVADGRRTDSVGMTLEEAARYMLKLGAVSALNFDGGGSSEMVLNNKVLNNPSDGRERAVSVGLGLFPKKN
ncbi:phosphodiester glycosidase family protein [Phascolarctobacterium sp.]